MLYYVRLCTRVVVGRDIHNHDEWNLIFGILFIINVS